MRVRFGLCVLPLIFACSSEPTDSIDPLDVRIYPSHAFAGGEVFLVGEWYRGRSDLPTVTADTFALVIRRVDDSTLAVALPSSVNGPLALHEMVHHADVDRGTVTVHGFTRRADVPIPPHLILTPSWTPGFPYIAINDSTGLSVLDPRTDQVTHYDSIGSLQRSGTQSCPLGAGPSYRPGEFILYRSTNAFPNSPNADLWDIVPDTVRHQAVPAQGCMSAEVAPSVYAIGNVGINTLQLYREDSSGFFTGLLTEVSIGITRFYRSPGGERLAFKAYRPGGAAVIDLQTYAVAYTVPSVEQVMDAAFSADGSRLYLAGSAGNIVTVNALTGDSIGGVVMDSALANVLALDPLRGLLYATVERQDSTGGVEASILVLDLTTLERVASVDIPECGNCTNDGVLMVDPANSELLLAVNGLTIFHFGLPPILQASKFGRISAVRPALGH